MFDDSQITAVTPVDILDTGFAVFEDMLSPQPVQPAERWIWVTFQKEGIHCYPAALTDPALASVSFLGHPHRHLFFHKVWIQVYHDDRDIEFILFKRWLESLYDEKVLDLDYKSCEMISDALFQEIKLKYPNRKVRIDISEDNENGCSIYYT